MSRCLQKLNTLLLFRMSNALTAIQHITRLYIPEPYASILMGVTYGVNIRVSRDITDQIVRSGLTHLIVLSGANITALLFLVEGLYKYIGKHGGLILYFLFLIFFISIVGLEPPLFRALIMFISVSICTLTGRPSYAIWNLWLSVCVIALLKPAFINARSFHLSVVATMGLIIGNRIIQKKYAIKHYLVRDFLISLSVFITTLPLTAWYFHTISLISPLATVVAGLLISPLMICGILLPVAHSIFPPLAYLIAVPTQVLLIALMSIIQFTSSVPHSFIQW